MASENAPTARRITRQALAEMAEILHGLTVLAGWQHELLRQAMTLLRGAPDGDRPPKRPQRRTRG